MRFLDHSFWHSINYILNKFNLWIINFVFSIISRCSIGNIKLMTNLNHIKITKTCFQCYVTSSISSSRASNPWRLKMGLISWPQMWVRNYHLSRRNNAEEASSLLLFVINSTECVLSRSRTNLFAAILSFIWERSIRCIVQKIPKICYKL